MEEIEAGVPEAPPSSHKPSPPRPAKAAFYFCLGPHLFSLHPYAISPVISHPFFFFLFSLSVTVEDRNPSVYRLETKSTHFRTIYPVINPNGYTGSIQRRKSNRSCFTALRDPRRMSPPVLTKFTTVLLYPPICIHLNRFRFLPLYSKFLLILTSQSTLLPFTVTLTATPTTLMFLDPPFLPQCALVLVSPRIMLLLSRGPVTAKKHLQSSAFLLFIPPVQSFLITFLC